MIRTHMHCTWDAALTHQASKQTSRQRHCHTSTRQIPHASKNDIVGSHKVSPFCTHQSNGPIPLPSRPALSKFFCRCCRCRTTIIPVYPRSQDRAPDRRRGRIIILPLPSNSQVCKDWLSRHTVNAYGSRPAGYTYLSPSLTRPGSPLHNDNTPSAGYCRTAER